VPSNLVSTSSDLLIFKQHCWSSNNSRRGGFHYGITLKAIGAEYLYRRISTNVQDKYGKEGNVSQQKVQATYNLLEAIGESKSP
jgi:hypothetical protein